MVFLSTLTVLGLVSNLHVLHFPLLVGTSKAPGLVISQYALSFDMFSIVEFPIVSLKQVNLNISF